MKELLGHHSLETTMRYSHLAPAHQAAAVAKLAAALAAPAVPAPIAAAGGEETVLVASDSRPKTKPDPARFSGRQTPAKKKYPRKCAGWRVEAGGIELPSEW